MSVRDDDPDRAGLLRAILATPGEDSVRLVFADWLDERGDEADRSRAEFIRVQCGTVKYEYAAGHDDAACCVIRCPVCDDKYTLLEDRIRERDLLHAIVPNCTLLSNESNWLRELVVALGTDFSRLRWEWSRGFVSGISLPCDLFLRHANDIFSRHPVTSVKLTDKEPEDMGYGWCWFNEPHDASPSSIPDELWHESAGADDDTRWVRANPQDCITAVSLRCVAYGRGLAELPPLGEKAGATA